MLPYKENTAVFTSEAAQTEHTVLWQAQQSEESKLFDAV
jgi:hypothetical protein